MRQTTVPVLNTVQEQTNLVRHNSNLDYDKVKKLIVSTQPLVADWPLSAVELGRNKTIKVEGKFLPITDFAYNSFLKNVLQVNPAFAHKFATVTDEKTELEMLSSLQVGLSLKKNERMKVVVDPSTLSVLNIGSSGLNYMSNESLLNIFEQVMNEFPSLQLKDLYISKLGKISLNVRSNNVVSIGEDEDYHGGLSFRNSPLTGSAITHNALRLICTNGMMGVRPVHMLKNVGRRSLSKLFESIGKLASNNFVNQSFAENVQRAMNSECSVHEFRTAERALLNHSNLPEQRIKEFLPVEDVRDFLAKRGVTYADLTDRQAQNCPTGRKLWEVVNHVTHFASHDLTSFNKDNAKLQATSGFLLERRHYDGENMVRFN